MYIEKINGPDDVKKIEVSELPKLAEEMRHALLIRASKHGGHFGPNGRSNHCPALCFQFAER